jgi:hypothetical protein
VDKTKQTIYLIVEGDGEREAAPLLMRRLLGELHKRYEFNKITAYNAHGNGNITVPGGLERFLELTRRQPDCMGVVVLLDAEQEHVKCPPGLACGLSKRARSLGLPFPVVVVCAVCEYESWFLYDVFPDHRHTIAEKWLKPGAVYEGNPEEECSAREWLKRNMESGLTYKETLDQPRMTAHLDIGHVREHSRSFKRLVNAVNELLEEIDRGKTGVTPLCQENRA